MSLKVGEGSRREIRDREDDVMMEAEMGVMLVRRTQSAIAGFEDGGRGRQPRKAGRL